jgi:O-antigen/teichoic acid export membrane protein
MLKSAVLVLSGNAFSAFLLLLRNLFIARLISVEDYGIAATFALSMAVVEMTSSIGLHQLIVQDKNGDDPDLQAGLQGFHLLRGILSGVILFLLAHPIAQFLGIPDVAWAYQVMALVPVMRGFLHFDVFRSQRTMKFMPLVLSTAAPALLSVLLVWPFFKLFGDYRVMLYAYMVQWGGMTLASHVVANRGYRLTMDRGVMARVMRFGWPLLINNILLLIVLQGEKLIVGREMGMASLAILAMGFTLTLTPVLVVTRSLQTFFLPQLSKLQSDREGFVRLSMVALQTGLAGSLLLVLAIYLIGEQALLLLFGAKYAALIPLLSWLAILQSLRLSKAGCAVVAISQGKTGNAMMGNLFRVLSMPVSWFVVVSGGSLLDIIWIGSIAEILGYAMTLGLVRSRVNLPLRGMVVPIAMTAAMWLAVIAGTGFFDAYADVSTWATPAVIVLFLLSIASMGDLRHYILKRFYKASEK